MKTDMTREIEKALRYYAPNTAGGIKINTHRGRSTAFEVPVECGNTSAGLVDCVRVQEYFADTKRETYCHIREHAGNGKEWAKAMDEKFRCSRGFGEGQKPKLCNATSCPYCSVREEGTPQILVTCYEIKASKADFRSKNGHNFVGNCNYYVVPTELYADIAELVPEDIGIILHSNASLRRKRECRYRDLTDTEQKWLILSVMKRKALEPDDPYRGPE